MDSTTLGLQQAQIFLIYSSVIMLIIITVFLVKLLIDTSRLFNALNDIAVILKHEVKPLVEEIQSTLQAVNAVCKTADNHVIGLKHVLSTVADVSLGTFDKAKGLSASFLSGAIAGFKLFKGYRRKK